MSLRSPSWSCCSARGNRLGCAAGRRRDQNRRRSRGRVGRLLLSAGSLRCRGFRALPRIPMLILAFVFLPITGLGPLTGTLAVGIHSIGTLGKLSSEVIEGIDEGPLESIKSSGGSKITELLFGVVPQVMPTITSYWLYRFEINLRASAVLGVVGAGGVGAELINQLRFRDFPRAGTVLVVTILMVLIVDTISAAIRKRIIKGREIKV